MTIEIYFNDLKEEKQKELLEACGYDCPEEANWDVDVVPIAIFSVDE